MNHDHAPVVGASGTFLSFVLADSNQVLSFLSALVALGYVGTKWVFLIVDRRRRK